MDARLSSTALFIIWLVGCTSSAGLGTKPRSSTTTSRASRREAAAALSPTLASVRGSDGSHLCTGTLIGANVVLVGAHCLNDDRKPNVYIENLNSGEFAKEYDQFETVESIVHPQFSADGTDYDAALLVLDTPSDRPTTALQSTGGCFTGKWALCAFTISTWGSFEGDVIAPRTWSRAESVKPDECAEFLQQQSLQKDTAVCAKPVRKLGCTALSDGPLLLKNKQIGVSSLNSEAGSCQDSLRTYTSVPLLLSWIKRELANLEEGDDCSCSRSGLSGGVQTMWEGCKQNMPGQPSKFSCMVKGGTKCSLANPSLKYLGAAWRLCGTLVVKPKSDGFTLPQLENPMQDAAETTSRAEQATTSCTFSWGVELTGEVMNNGAHHITKSELECCALCDQTLGCEAWTRISKLIPEKHAWGECWLRKQPGQQLLSYYSNSGSRSGEMNREGTSCSVMPGVDLAGGGTINDGRDLISQSESECCKYCDSTAGCEAWTRITQETEANPWGQCWLWNRTNLAGRTGFTSSGVAGGTAVEFFHQETSMGSAASG